MNSPNELFPGRAGNEPLTSLEVAKALAKRALDQMEAQTGSPDEVAADLAAACVVIVSRRATKDCFLFGMDRTWDIWRHDKGANPIPLTVGEMREAFGGGDEGPVS